MSLVEMEKPNENKELLEAIKDWLSFSLTSQHGIMKEMEYLPFPQWNSGYLECLNDLNRIIEES